MIGIVLTELALIADGHFKTVADVKRQTGTGFQTELVQIFALNLINRAVRQGNHRNRIILNKIIGCGNMNFRTNAETAIGEEILFNPDSENTGQNVIGNRINSLSDTILISVLFNVEITNAKLGSNVTHL